MTNLQAFHTSSANWFCFPTLAAIPQLWRDQLFSDNDNPFTSQGFLLALEQSGCIGKDSGWYPQYYVYQQGSELGLLLSYNKSHSYGEYVFDWAWADAYHRSGIHYYPKSVAAVPFSPIPCNKWLGNSSLTELAAYQQVSRLLPESELTGFHYLFSKQPLVVDSEHWVMRQGHQFHWFNQDLNGQRLTSFEHYLEQMTARKRKSIKKERNKVQQAGVSCYWRSGEAVTQQELEVFYQCYHATYIKRGQSGYLNLAFFQLLCQYLPQQVQILFCQKAGNIIAAAMYLRSDDTLYGRYWGCLEQGDLVHFEACYYQGIEFAIAHRLQVFNPGTQGEHKIARGFKPIVTYSYHQLALAPFQAAIKSFCQQERVHNRAYIQQCMEKLPFKQIDN